MFGDNINVIKCEETVLSMMMNNTHCMIVAASDLQMSDFCNKRCGEIFNALCRCEEVHHEFIFDFVLAFLEKRNVKIMVAELSAMLDIIDEGVSNIKDYTIKQLSERIKIIKGRAKVRDLALVAKRIAVDAERYEDAKSFISKAQSDLLEQIQKSDIAEDVIGTTQACQELLEEMHTRDGNPVTGLETGLPSLDQMIYGLNKQEVTIIAAGSSIGKSTLALNMIRHTAVHQQSKVLLFSLEMSYKRLHSRLIAQTAYIEMGRLRDGTALQEQYSARMTEAINVLDACNIGYVVKGVSAPEVAGISRTVKTQNGLDLVVIDYLQLMTPHTNESRDRQIGEITRDLKQLAIELDVPVVILSQLNRSKNSRNDTRPRLCDLRDSGNIEQDADVVIFIYNKYREGSLEDRNDEKAKDCNVELIVAKQRDGEIGTIKARFRGKFNRFDEIGNDF